MPKTAAPDWAAIRHRYEETDAAVAGIAASAGISKAELDKARKRDGWIRHKPRGLRPGRRQPPTNIEPSHVEPPPQSKATKSKATPTAKPTPNPKPKPKRPPTSGDSLRRRLLDRLVAAISLKLEQLERRMSQDLETLEHSETASSTDHERETRAIGALIDNLGKVTEMETGLDRASASSKSSAISDIAGEADRYRRELAERLRRIIDSTAGTT